MLLLKPSARRSLKKCAQWYPRELPGARVLTQGLLSFAGIELSLADREKESDRAKHKGSKGPWRPGEKQQAEQAA